jgi:hypothetical protein
MELNAMKDIMDKLEYKGKEYKLIFNLNVLEEIQDKYGTLENILAEAYGNKTGEPSIKALSFMIMSMVNEGIDIDNESKNVPEPFITQKQANRMLTDFIQGNGVENVVKLVDDLMAKSLQGGENSKNE